MNLISVLALAVFQQNTIALQGVPIASPSATVTATYSGFVRSGNQNTQYPVPPAVSPVEVAGTVAGNSVVSSTGANPLVGTATAPSGTAKSELMGNAAIQPGAANSDRFSLLGTVSKCSAKTTAVPNFSGEWNAKSKLETAAVGHYVTLVPTIVVGRCQITPAVAGDAAQIAYWNAAAPNFTFWGQKVVTFYGAGYSFGATYFDGNGIAQSIQQINEPGSAVTPNPPAPLVTDITFSNGPGVYAAGSNFTASLKLRASAEVSGYNRTATPTITGNLNAFVSQ